MPISSLPPPHFIKETRSAFIRILNSFKEIFLMVRFPEVILYIVILGWNSQLDKLILERTTLLEEAVYFSCYLHIYLLNVGFS